jgi:hypothetical protein
MIKEKAEPTDKRKEQLRKYALKYRNKNLIQVRERERIYKLNFREFERLRTIDIFD